MADKKNIQHQQARAALSALRVENARPVEATQREQLRRDMLDRGFVDPVIATEDGRVLHGGERLTVYREMLTGQGLSPAQVDGTEVPIVRISGIDAQGEGTLQQAMQRIGTGGIFDYARIGSVLDQLSGGDLDTKLGSGSEPERATSPVNRVEGRPAEADKPTEDAPLQHAVGGGRFGTPNRPAEGQASADQAVLEQQRRVHGTGATSPSAPADAPKTATENPAATTDVQAAKTGGRSAAAQPAAGPAVERQNIETKDAPTKGQAAAKKHR